MVTVVFFFFLLIARINQSPRHFYNLGDTNITFKKKRRKILKRDNARRIACVPNSDVYMYLKRAG